MAIGQERRTATETNEDRSLRAMGQITPVSIPQAAQARPNVPQVNRQPTVGQRMASRFAQYASGELGKAANIQHERSMMDGAMAAQQGQTFEDVEMGGDKWALEGYRVVQAQTLASTLLTAQRSEIAQGLYELSPDEYRARFVDRVEGVLGSTTDPRTADLAREQMLRQMPTLVEDHTTQNLAWQEQKNFEALEQSVDTISMDPTSADALIAFAQGGEGSPTAGLSEDRRREAVVSGIARAFHNDNPQAYAILSASGVLADMPVAQQRAIQSAKAAFEQRNRQTYNAEFIAQEDELMDKIASGELEPQAAMDLYGDLMAEHNMTMTQSEAGAIYTESQRGTNNRRINTGLATQEAYLRGDRTTAVTLIERSLSGTESGGNSEAFRTNQDGRSFGGTLQFGAARLTDYNRATGNNLTLDQFRRMPKAEQSVVNKWHINDYINQMEADGSINAVGTTINGVTVTLSGLVAMAHLGGYTGMQEYVAGNGNPTVDHEDELGTSLTDYLRKHGNGVDLGPEEAARAAASRIQVVRETAAIDAFEQSQPQFAAIDEAYQQGGITEDVWRESRAEVREQYGIARTMADAEFEMSVTDEVKRAANEVLDEQMSLEALSKLEAASENMQAAIDGYSVGNGTIEDVIAAQTEHNTARSAIRAEYGIPLNAEEEISQYRKQADRVRTAVDARMQFDEEQAQINAANMSGTAGELPAPLQRRAVQQASERAMANVQDQIAQGTITQEQGQDMHGQQMLDFYAQSGVVDPNMERVMNGFLSGGLVDRNGEPRQEYIDAATNYRDLMNRSPNVADKYVRPENQATLDAIIDIAGQGPLEGAVRTLGVRQSQAPRVQTTEEFVSNPDIIKRVDRAVSQYLRQEEIGVTQAIVSSTADLQQTKNRSWFGPYRERDDENYAILQDRVTAEVADAHRREPLLHPSELVGGATRRVNERTPVIGGIAVQLPMNGPSAGERFFGARANDFTDQAGAINDAVMDHFRSPGFKEQYPFVDDTQFNESLPTWLPEIIRGQAGTPEEQVHTWVTGVRPFQTYYDQASDQFIVQFNLPSGGSSDAIALDAKTIGQNYMRRHTAAAAER